MSFLAALPEDIGAASAATAAIAAMMGAAQGAAAPGISGVVPPGAPTEPAGAFAAILHQATAAEFDAVHAEALAMHALFTAALAESAGSYGLTEAANTIPLG